MSMSVEIQPVAFLRSTLTVRMEVLAAAGAGASFAGQMAGKSSQSAQSDRDVVPVNWLYILHGRQQKAAAERLRGFFYTA